MGCVHTHQKILAIEGWGSPSCIQSTMKNTKKTIQIFGKIDQTISLTLALGPKHDRIKAQWALDILSESMLKKV
jgi:hypothetical protein